MLNVATRPSKTTLVGSEKLIINDGGTLKSTTVDTLANKVKTPITELVSADSDNRLKVGQDGKLSVPDLTTDLLAQYILAKS